MDRPDKACLAGDEALDRAEADRQRPMLIGEQALHILAVLGTIKEVLETQEETHRQKPMDNTLSMLTLALDGLNL